jgi:hypothetical protein
MRCISNKCNYKVHSNTNNNDGSHCCKLCKQSNGITHGDKCEMKEISILNKSDDLNYKSIENIPLDFNIPSPTFKICYIILTCEKYINTRVKWQKETCFRNTSLSDCYYLSCKNGDGVYGWNTDDNYKSCIIKYIKFFQNMNLDYDWYMFIDDDTFVFPSRVKKYLARLNHKEHVYVGAIWTHIRDLRFMSGGAGFFFSKPSYKMLRDFLSVEKNTLLREPEASDHGDASVGVWIREINRNNDYCIKLYSDSKYLKIGNTYILSEVLQTVTIHYVNNETMFKMYNIYLEETDLKISFPKKIDNIPFNGTIVSFSPFNDDNMFLRQSYSKISLTKKDIGPKEDYLFFIRLMPNCKNDSIFIESVNFPKKFLAAETGEIFIKDDKENTKENMCWKIEKTNVGNSFKIVCVSSEPQWLNTYITIPNAGEGRVVLKKEDSNNCFSIFEIPTLYNFI